MLREKSTIIGSKLEMRKALISGTLTYILAPLSALQCFNLDRNFFFIFKMKILECSAVKWEGGEGEGV